VDRSTGELLGSIGVRYLGGGTGETGYWVKREARGRGVATRALVLLARWALTEKVLARFQLRADVENEASQRVAERPGSCGRASCGHRSSSRARDATSSCIAREGRSLGATPSHHPLFERIPKVRAVARHLWR
jgi:hypothetical protein